MDIMLADYTNLVCEMNLEGVIAMIAHIKTISIDQTTRHSGRAELWNKLQILLVKAFEMRHEMFEYQEDGENAPLPLDKESIMIMASILIASETSGHLRDPAVINYLFKSVFELTDFDEDGYQQFSMQDIATLVDASYKSQMMLQDKYGDLFYDILDKQGLLDQDYLETQPVKQTLRMFRGFAHMTNENLTEPNRGNLLRLMDNFLRSEMAVKEIEPTMWLSVVDFAQKLEMQELGIFAQAMFFKNF